MIGAARFTVTRRARARARSRRSGWSPWVRACSSAAARSSGPGSCRSAAASATARSCACRPGCRRARPRDDLARDARRSVGPRHGVRRGAARPSPLLRAARDLSRARRPREPAGRRRRHRVVGDDVPPTPARDDRDPQVSRRRLAGARGHVPGPDAGRSALLGSLAGAALGVARAAAARPGARPVRAVRARGPVGRRDGRARASHSACWHALLCALWPLLAVRAVPALAHPPARRRRERVARRAVRGRRRSRSSPGLAALAVWQAGSLKLGAIFLGASLAALALLFGLSRAAREARAAAAAPARARVAPGPRRPRPPGRPHGAGGRGPRASASCCWSRSRCSRRASAVSSPTSRSARRRRSSSSTCSRTSASAFSARSSADVGGVTPALTPDRARAAGRDRRRAGHARADRSAQARGAGRRSGTSRASTC